MEEAFMVTKGDDLMDLPPGFRFHPTDEEIITHYLKEKVMNSSFSASAIGEADLNKCEPWDLPKKAKMGEKEWYFFCQRDRKYPTGMRTNRATESGYWKATGKDREIFKGKACLVGMKKTLVFYRGRAPKGEKTNWVMHEYRLEGNFSYYNLTKASILYSSRLPHTDEWAVCRVFYKNSGIKKSPIPGVIRINSFGNDLLNCPDLLPPLMEAPLPSSSRPAGEDVFKGANTSSSSARLLDENCLSYFSITSPTDHQLQRQQVGGQKTFLLPSNNYTTNTNYQAPNSVFHSQIEIPLWGANFPCQASPDLDYLHKDKDGHCKVEQMSSNQSMVSLSGDTGLSTDVNTEISSVASKHEIGIHRPYEDLQGPSVGPMPDLTFLWDY